MATASDKAPGSAAAKAAEPPVLQDTADAQKAGAYEVLRARLLEQSQALRERAEQLNARRKDVFGGMETALIGSTRIKTEHSCIPRDIIHVGKKLIIGYDVFLGLKTQMQVSDVFAVYDFDGQEFKSIGLDFLNDARFTKDFQEIFQYYKSARLAQMRNTGTHLLFIFQIGPGKLDVKVCRWSIERDGSLQYMDNRGDREHAFPPQFDFEWIRATRDDQVQGRYPHFSIANQLFVECIGGDLTIKIEDNTESGQGIFSEPVQDADQSLDDAEIHYAVLENLILLKVKPFNEETIRYIGYSKISQQAKRIDAIGQSCVQLPEGHGVIFPGGCFLQTGESKQFDENIADMEFFKSIRSWNGEDVLYLFYHRVDGRYILLQYNMVKKELANPILCHGYSQYDDGKFVIFRNTNNEAGRSHPVQIWQTPFTGESYEPPAKGDSYLTKIGNKDLVTGISDSLTLVKLARDSVPTNAAYEDLIKQGDSLLDRHHWLNHADCFNLGATIKQIRETGAAILEEFEKVVRIRKNTAEQIGTFSEELTAYFGKARPDGFRTLDDHVKALSHMRGRRGHLISLRDLRYSDLPRLQQLEEQLIARYNDVSQRTVKFLLSKDALVPYTAKFEELGGRIENLAKVADAPAIQDELTVSGEGLDLLAEIINNLKIDDSTARTEIIEALSGIYAQLNRAKAMLASRRKDLLGKELVAEFAAQFKLLAQSLANYIALCDTPEKCDEFLSKLLVQVEELEGRFSDFPEYIEKIAEKRDEVYNAFSTRKQQLLDERQRKSGALAAAADRILKNVSRRTFKSPDELNGYFASDPMVLKVVDIIERLREINDSVRAEELAGRMKATREEALRILRDKIEIFEDGANIVKFGTHRFAVNTEPLDLSLVPRDGTLCFHITGTDYYHPIEDEKFRQFEKFFAQNLPSENNTVYRAEYLAWRMLDDAEAGRNNLSIEILEIAAVKQPQLLELIRKYTSELYDEGYERGIHDHDAAVILAKLVELRGECGLLRFDPLCRAYASIFWSRFADESRRDLLMRKAQNLGRMQQVFKTVTGIPELLKQIADEMRAFFTAAGADTNKVRFDVAASYLFEELRQDKNKGFACSQAALEAHTAFLSFLTESSARAPFENDLRALDEQLAHALHLTCAWLDNFSVQRLKPEERWLADEVLGLLLTPSNFKRQTILASSSDQVSGLLGQHARIDGGKLNIRLDEFMSRISNFALNEVPAYVQYQQTKKQLVDRERGRLRLDEFKPKAMSTFVRNRLINDVYLPLIGENLGKQMGEAGANKRTDLMGLLLLISPPGYGKTTLMEYIASRLGLIFVKINGPALGTHVLSLDPDEAPNATAREEIEKLNLALEMGNNVMLYLDDIQHTNPEFLQKFISLCDAQRKIEGVFKGRTRTYDFRGKKVCVVMAGNPYTESGARFQIPDMLANRADTYNLGDILGGRTDLFELSYLENAITSNATLRPLATREMKDFYKLVDMADGAQVAETDLGHDYSPTELKDIIELLKKLRKVQKTVLRVNQEYIASAAQKDEFRTEPPFKLQGSYRNMNKIASKVLPVLTDAEMENLIQDHYVGESQTLASASEHNLLKLGEVRGTLSDVQRVRWEDIKKSFNRSQLLGGAGKDDKVAHVIAQLATFNDNLERIRKTIGDAAAAKPDNGSGEKLEAALTKLAETLQKGGGDASRDAALLAAVEKLGTTGGQIDIQPKVEIVNTLPEYYTNLYRHHLNMIESVLVPVITGLSQQMKSTDDIHKMLNAVSESLRAVLDELGKQKRRKKSAETELPS